MPAPGDDIMARVFLTGGTGMVGSAFLRLIKKLKPHWVVTAPSRAELDLCDRHQVLAALQVEAGAQPPTPHYDLVIHAGAKVGGIKANSDHMADFFTQNMMMGLNVIGVAAQVGIKNLINLGSSCMYPRDFGEKLREEDILAAPLEPTNEGYALAKIATAKLCEYVMRENPALNYKTIIPCNLYGPGDRYDSVSGHLFANVIMKIHAAIREGADQVEIWGDGTPRREFVFVDDMVSFVLGYADHLGDLPGLLNLGAGYDLSVRDLYQTVAAVLGYHGNFYYNEFYPNGMNHKLMDISRARSLGWSPPTALEKGIMQTYQDYKAKTLG